MSRIWIIRRAYEALRQVGARMRAPRLHTWRSTALSDDGARLYAAITDRVARLDAASGTEVGTLQIGDVDAIVGVLSSGP
jgi:hypothetical protein